MSQQFFNLGKRAVPSADAEQMAVAVGAAERGGKLNIVQRIRIGIAVGECKSRIDLPFRGDQVLDLGKRATASARSVSDGGALTSTST